MKSGWYRVAETSPQFRFWDGKKQRWTEMYADDAQVGALPRAFAWLAGLTPKEVDAAAKRTTLK